MTVQEFVSIDGSRIRKLVHDTIVHSLPLQKIVESCLTASESPTNTNPSELSEMVLETFLVFNLEEREEQEFVHGSNVFKKNRY